MDSTGNILRIEGFKVNVGTNGKTVKVTDAAISGQPEFLALIQSSSAIDPSAPLGMDIREADIIETLRAWLPSSLLASSTPAKITATTDGVTYQMTKREDNLASPFVRFEVVKVI